MMGAGRVRRGKGYVNPGIAEVSARSFRKGNQRMERGVAVGIHLTPGIPDENFVGGALGNLTAYLLAKERGESLVWQVLRVQEGNSHHFRLVVRHPDRRLDWGFERDLAKLLQQLSAESVEDLRHRLDRAVREGLKPVPLRSIEEEVDYWRDDFWNWMG